ncbi:tyrosine-protein phosphatase Lar-like [Ptychodera flava]|uniref:tyrosine-protein phosphatase Lar-like n=1 Tax=Ptychodera flava TaxID=63121 RepID=UPI003969C16C
MLSEEGKSHDCDYSPNKRAITISWEKPNEHYWHGELQRYEVHFWYKDLESNLPASNVTVIERDINDTSMVLEDIWRWKSLTIDVYTCNSVGCKGSEKPIQIDAVKVARNAPLIVSAKETSSSSFLVVWVKPINDECIKSYNVRYTSDRHQGEIEVTDLYADIIGVLAGTEYSVSVSANIYNGYDSTDEGEPRSTTVRLINDNQTVAIVTAVLFSFVILCLCILCCSRKYWGSIKERCLKSVAKKELKEDKGDLMLERHNCPL